MLLSITDVITHTYQILMESFVQLTKRFFANIVVWNYLQ